MGRSREEAEAWVRHSYIEAKDGVVAAEQDLSEQLQELRFLSEHS
jgi:hypothetical protein